MKLDIAILKEKVENIEEKIKEFITRNEIVPMRALVYGLAGLILIAVIEVILKGIFK